MDGASTDPAPELSLSPFAHPTFPLSPPSSHHPRHHQPIRPLCFVASLSPFSSFLPSGPPAAPSFLPPFPHISSTCLRREANVSTRLHLFFLSHPRFPSTSIILHPSASLLFLSSIFPFRLPCTPTERGPIAKIPPYVPRAISAPSKRAPAYSAHFLSLPRHPNSHLFRFASNRKNNPPSALRAPDIPQGAPPARKPISRHWRNIRHLQQANAPANAITRHQFPELKSTSQSRHNHRRISF